MKKIKNYETRTVFMLFYFENVLKTIIEKNYKKEVKINKFVFFFHRQNSRQKDEVESGPKKRCHPLECALTK